MATEKLDTERRIYVKIRFNKNDNYPTLAKTVYYRNGMTIPFFARWKWFFQYREALIRVKFPRSYVELSYGPYDYVLPKEIYRKKIKDLISGNKRMLTQYKNKIEYVKQNWNEIFPPEQHPEWGKVMAKLQKYEQKIQELTNEYNMLDSDNPETDATDSAAYYKELFNIDYINIKVF